MPIYEFDCKECGEKFDKLVRSSAAQSEVVCPSCGSDEVKKRMSLFAAAPSGGSSSSLGSSCSTGST